MASRATRDCSPGGVARYPIAIPAPCSAGRAANRMRLSRRSVTGFTSGCTPPLAAAAACQTAMRFARSAVVVELAAVEAVVVEVDDDRVAVLDQRDRAAEERLRRDVADDEADGAAGEAGVGHERDRDASCWRHSAVMRDVGSSISGMPGAPRGPS